MDFSGFSEETIKWLKSYYYIGNLKVIHSHSLKTFLDWTSGIHQRGVLSLHVQKFI